ncbi:alpha/beta hydrolase family protein [Gynurincola endophyticus]|uniref:alpha/beta hydrolase family protein n=1 Tax=Gynurincola endophyticus TaxID=2479004 RepID=UPI000F8E5484|nr:S9 family peptidase [Gynurincola endophyticus]
MNVLNQLTGSWKADLAIQGNKVVIQLEIKNQNDTTAALVSITELGLQNLNVFPVVDGNNVNFSIPPLGVEFKGIFDGETLAGEIGNEGDTTAIQFTSFEKKLPGNPALVSSAEELNELIQLDKGDFKYKVEDYFQRPEISAFALSPQGRYISFREKNAQHKRPVYIREISTGKVLKVIDEVKELVRDYYWLSDEKLLYFMDNGGDENYHLYTVNVDGSNNIDLTPFEGVKAGVINVLKEDPDHMIISMNKENPQVFEPYKVNVHTGELVKLYENKDVVNPIQSYTFNKDGLMKGFSKLKDGVNTQYFYKAAGEEEFKLLYENKYYDHHAILAFDYSQADEDIVYLVSNLQSDKARIEYWNLKTYQQLKTVLEVEEYDAAGLRLSRKRNWEIDFFTYEGEKQEIIPVSETFKEIYKKLNAELGDDAIHIIDRTDEEDRFLVYVTSDKLYGKYYLYDHLTGKIELLMDLMPQLKEEDMASMKPIRFQSRDGLTIHGYITLPEAALSGKKVPLIVNPHGGPQGIRDSWAFNPEAQLFASRGYATLHVNFRISGGYGKEFMRKGFKQIGRACMNDVEDGVLYVIEQGWIDVAKIAIYGGSHGGYAALMGLVKTPKLYACSVDYVGVSNLETFFQSIPPYWKPMLKIIKEIWYDLDNPAEKEIALEVSPIFHIDKIERPLFVVQGANDPRVNIHESDQIVSELRSRGFNVPYMVKYNEGHGFAHEENRIELYKAMMGFFSKYLGGK